MIEVTDLVKHYEGFQALKGVSFKVPTGSIFGFIGPNGAGKTTTLKILGALLRPESGSAKIMGVDVSNDPDEVRRLVGWMPDQYGVYPDLQVWEYLDFFAAAYGIARAKRRDIIDNVLELTDLAGKRSTYVGGLSRGMTQKLCLARALLHEPQVLLLDEPASGLDPQARIELKELLKELQQMGKTVLVSSHILPELAEYCNGIAIIQGGSILFAGPITELRQKMGNGAKRLRVRLLDGLDRAAELLKTRPDIRRVQKVEGDELEIELAGGEENAAQLLQALVGQGLKVAGMREMASDLEDLFLKITSNSGAEGRAS